MIQKPKILLMAEGVSMAHPTRVFQMAQWLSKNFDVHFATTKESFAFLDCESANLNTYELASVPNVVFNERLFNVQLPVTLAELNSFANEDQRLLDLVKPDLVITDFRLSYKGIWKKNKIPWFNLNQYHWHPDYLRRPIVPTVLPVQIFGRKLVEIFSPLIASVLLKKQLSIVHEFENQHDAPLSSSLFDFYSSGDHLLWPDMAEIYDLPLEIFGGTFIGPIIWKNSKIPWPSSWPVNQWTGAENKKTAYVSLGSTGPQKLNPQIVESLLELNFRIYLAGNSEFIDKIKSTSVRQARLLPSDLILQQSDLMICNGGTGTTYHSFSHGVPVVGIVTNMDQCLHMDALKQKNLGEYFFTDSFNRQQFSSAVQKITSVDGQNAQIQITRQQIKNYQNDNKLEQTIRRFI